MGTFMGMGFPPPRYREWYRRLADLEVDPWWLETECAIVQLLDGMVVYVQENRWELLNEDGEKCKVTGDTLIDISYKQFPLRLAYALTVHKAQGMSLDAVDFDCAGIFAEHQMYVALSRVRSLEGLTLRNWNRKKVFVNQDVKNFYSQMALDEFMEDLF
jgi:hypothetical protein